MFSNLIEYKLKKILLFTNYFLNSTVIIKNFLIILFCILLLKIFHKLKNKCKIKGILHTCIIKNYIFSIL